MPDEAPQEAPESSESSSEQTFVEDVQTPSSSVETPSENGEGVAYNRDELMDVVRKAIGDIPAHDESSSEQAAESPAADAQAKPAEEAGKGGEAKDDKSEAPRGAEDFSDVPFNKHPRFQELIAEKNEYKAKAEEMSSQIEALTPDADEWNKVSAYMKENGIASEAMAELFEYAALVTTGRVDKALEMARKQVAELEALTGHKLSPDLQRRIDDGVMDEESARQLSTAQSRLELERRMHQREMEAAQQQTKVANTEAVMDAVRQWEKKIRSEDTDYGLKHEAVQDRLKLELSKPGGMPTSAKAGVELVQNIYDQVSAWPVFKNESRLTPNKSVTGGSSPRAPARQPASMLEAVQMALEQ